MNVKRIVVDKKDGCVACPFCIRVNDYMRDYYECRVTSREVFDCTGMKYREYIEKFEEIGTPDWCPLEVEKCCEWKLFVTKYPHEKVTEWDEDMVCQNCGFIVPCTVLEDHLGGKEECKYCPSCGKRIKYVEVE